MGNRCRTCRRPRATDADLLIWRTTQDDDAPPPDGWVSERLCWRAHWPETCRGAAERYAAQAGG